MMVTHVSYLIELTILSVAQSDYQLFDYDPRRIMSLNVKNGATHSPMRWNVIKLIVKLDYVYTPMRARDYFPSRRRSARCS